MKVNVGRLGAIAAVFAGVCLGIGGFTFRYANGLSYFSSDPKACVNCHIMQGQYDSWAKASHHAAAACVDCHLPHSLVPKLVAKSDNGYHHSRAFTLQDFHEPIQITPGNARILQDNCVRCHESMVQAMLARTTGPGEVKCVQCHAASGHGPTR